jgi:hypothetical protein
VVSGGAGDGYCTIARYAERAGAPAYKQCSFKLSEVLRTLSAMGAHYPEAIELLRQVEKSKCLPCAVAINAFPSATPVDILAACGSDAHKFKDSPEFQQEVLAAQEDLGIFASPLARGKR